MSPSQRPEPPRPARAPADGPLRAVRKRDGRRATFDPSKIKGAVWRAMQSVGDSDQAFAEDVAAVVALALRREAELSGESDFTPDIETIQDRVERALIEMGRAAVAKAYILYRDRRARARQLTASGAPRRSGAPGAITSEAVSSDAASIAAVANDVGANEPTRTLRVHRADQRGPWHRGRIAAALVAEADLPRELAERVAAQVEARVLASGLEDVSTALVRAFVDHELAVSGLADALRHTTPVAVPRHDIRRITAGAGAEIWEPWRRPDAIAPGVPLRDGIGSEPTGVEAIGGEVMRRFALSEILDARSAELHTAGELHVEDLTSPQRFLHASISPEFLGHQGPFAALEAVADVLSTTTRGATLDAAGALVRDLLDGGESLDPWLLALRATARAAGQVVCLRCDGAEFAAERAALVTALARAEPGAQQRRSAGAVLFMDVDGLAECLDGDAGLRRATLDAVAAGRLLATWHRGEGRAAGAGCVRLPGEHGLVAVGGAVGLNLVRLARRSGPWQEERFMEELFGLLACAHDACRSLATFQSRTGPTRSGRLHARSTFALVPIGLPQALRHLGDGEADPVQGARVLGLMAEAASRFPEPGAPRLDVCAFFGAEGARRLAFVDRTSRDAPRAEQAWLFAEMSGQDSEVRAYTPGFAFGTSTAWRRGEAEAELVRTIPSGVLHPLLGSDRGSARTGTPLVESQRSASAPSEAEAAVSKAVVLERFVALHRAVGRPVGRDGESSSKELQSRSASPRGELFGSETGNARASAGRGPTLRLLTEEPDALDS